MSGGGSQRHTGVPEAVVGPRRGVSPAWLVPLAAAILAGWLGWAAWSARGVEVVVHLSDGHGLNPGDLVRYRGIAVGEVRAVELDDDLAGARVRARLHEEVGRLAVAGSRFWVVRPQLGLGGVEGLETIVGPRYLAVLPGGGRRQREFIGLDEPPVVDRVRPGDLEVILAAPQRGSLRRGAPVIYRQVRVGTVLSVGLTSDGGAVEARVHLDAAYAQLVRERTHFWRTGGLEARVGLAGMTVELESLEALVGGGVALATPPDAGGVVRTGHRFELADEAPEDWLSWQPLAVIGSDLLPPGAPLPVPQRATLGWRQGRWITRARSRQGWVLQTTEGLLGPADLLEPAEKADRQTVAMEVAGKVVPLIGEPLWRTADLAMVRVRVVPSAWPAERQRTPQRPEDCLAVADPNESPLPLAAARLEVAGPAAWRVDPAVSVDRSWHGAAVVARSDGFLVGMLLVDEEGVRVAVLAAGTEGQRD